MLAYVTSPLLLMHLPRWVFSGVGSVAYSHASQGGVAFFAHVGGFLCGMLLISVLPTNEPYRQRRELHW